MLILDNFKRMCTEKHSLVLWSSNFCWQRHQIDAKQRKKQIQTDQHRSFTELFNYRSK